MRCNSVCLSLKRRQLGAVGKWRNWVTTGNESWQCYPVPVVCPRTALLCSNAASANDPAVALSAMNCCWFMGPCHTSHHSFLYMVYWWGNHGISGDKAIEDSLSKLSFLSLHLWWPFRRERHKPCWEVLQKEILHIVKPVNLLLLPVGYWLLKAISHSFIAPGDNTAGTGVFFLRWWHIFMMLHGKLLIKPWRTAQRWGKQNRRQTIRE